MQRLRAATILEASRRLYGAVLRVLSPALNQWARDIASRIEALVSTIPKTLERIRGGAHRKALSRSAGSVRSFARSDVEQTSARTARRARRTLDRSLRLV